MPFRFTNALVTYLYVPLKNHMYHTTRLMLRIINPCWINEYTNVTFLMSPISYH